SRLQRGKSIAVLEDVASISHQPIVREAGLLHEFNRFCERRVRDGQVWRKTLLRPNVSECLSSVFALGLRQFFGESQQGLVVGWITDPAGTLDHAAKKFNDLGAAPLRCRPIDNERGEYDF